MGFWDFLGNRKRKHDPEEEYFNRISTARGRRKERAYYKKWAKKRDAQQRSSKYKRYMRARSSHYK